jgi:hypothetical protein
MDDQDPFAGAASPAENNLTAIGSGKQPGAPPAPSPAPADPWAGVASPAPQAKADPFAGVASPAPKPPPQDWRVPAMKAVGDLGRNAEAGLEGMVGPVYDVARLPFNLAGANIPTFEKQIEDASPWPKEADTKTGRVVTDLTRGAGMALPMLAGAGALAEGTAGATSTAGQVANRVGQAMQVAPGAQMAGMATSEAARGATERSGGGWGAQLLASMAGFVPGAELASLADKTINPLLEHLVGLAKGEGGNAATRPPGPPPDGSPPPGGSQATQPLDSTAATAARKETLNANLSAATDSIPGLKNLQDAANGGDLGAHRLLNNIAQDSLERLTSGIPSAKMEADYNSGLYGGSLEPSLGVKMSYAPEDKNAVMSALSKFQDNFDQQQIHVRGPATDAVGTSYPDGSYVTPVARFDLNKPLSRAQIENVASQSGLDGFTANDKYLETYYVGDPHDADAIANWEAGANRAEELLKGSVRSVGRSFQKLGIQDVRDTARPAGQGDSNLPPPAQTTSDIPRQIAERVKGSPVEPAQQATEVTPAQRALQQQIAREYEALPINDLQNPLVQKAYNELGNEVKKQYQALPIKVDVGDPAKGEPYKSSAEMRNDVLQNQHLTILPTTPETFGPKGTDFSNHPLLQDSGLTSTNGKKLLMNDALRAVHDYYAHVTSPVDFGPKGEEAAWRNHVATLDNPWARWALTSETRGQNSWVNFGDHVKPGTPLRDRPFAEQKAALLPLRNALTGNEALDKPLQDFAGQLSLEDRQGSLKAPVGDRLQPDKTAQEVAGSTNMQPAAPGKVLPMTAGEKTQNPDIQRKEADAFAGASGAKAQQAANDFRAVRNDALTQLPGVERGVAGGNPADRIANVASLIRENSANAKGEVDDAYNTARGLGKGLNLSADDMSKNLVPKLQEYKMDFGMKPETTPKAASQMQDLMDLSRSADGKALLTDGETWRRATSNLAANATDPADAKALRGLVRIYDNYMEDLSERLSNGEIKSHLQGHLADQFSDLTQKKMEADRAVALANRQLTLAMAAKHRASDVYTTADALATERNAQSAYDSALRRQSSMQDMVDTVRSRLGVDNDQNASSAIRAFKEAVASRREYGRLYQGNDFVEDMIGGNKSIDDLTKNLLGSGSTGGKQGMLDNYNALMRAAGEDAPAVREHLQTAFGQRIYDRASSGLLANSQTPAISPAKLKTELTNMFVRQRQLATSLYGADAVAKAQQAINELNVITAKQSNVGNVSNSGYTLARLQSMARASGLLAHIPGFRWVGMLAHAANEAISNQNYGTEAAKLFNGEIPAPRNGILKGAMNKATTAATPITRGSMTEYQHEEGQDGQAAGGRTLASGGRANPNPSDAQKKAGNYKKGRLKFHGLDVSIENFKGSTRSGKDKNGKEWSVKMPVRYGYIRRTEGADGDHVDAFIGPHPATAEKVYVIDQINHENRRFDEHKCMLGFDSHKDALLAYRKSFSDGKGIDRIGYVTEMSVGKFKKWLKDGDTTKSLAA